MKASAIAFVVILFQTNSDERTHLRSVLQGLPVITVENTPENNFGFARGANKGIEIALKKGSDWIVILNQDISASKKTFPDLIEDLRRTPPGVYGPVVGSLDDRRWTTILGAEGGQIYISGSCLVVHRMVIEHIGKLYEPYFLYYEDADFSVRAGRAGFPVKKLELRDFYHDDRGESQKTPNPAVAGRDDTSPQDRKEYYLARNHLLFVERLAPFSVKLYETVRLPYTYVEHVAKGETMALNGVRDYMKRKFGPL